MKASPTLRFYSVAADAKGKESEFQTLDLAGYVDVTLGPHLPHSRQKEDWQTKKYVWARIGYDHIFKAEEKTTVALGGPWHRRAVREALSSRLDPRRGAGAGGPSLARKRLLDAVPLSSGGEPRLRRVRPRRHALLPGRYFYDTRSHRWSRELYQAGAEIAVTRHFRVEPSVARQVDDLRNPFRPVGFRFRRPVYLLSRPRIWRASWSSEDAAGNGARIVGHHQRKPSRHSNAASSHRARIDGDVCRGLVALCRSKRGAREPLDGGDVPTHASRTRERRPVTRRRAWCGFPAASSRWAPRSRPA